MKKLIRLWKKLFGIAKEWFEHKDTALHVSQPQPQQISRWSPPTSDNVKCNVDPS